jgi:hypothetical protein
MPCRVSGCWPQDASCPDARLAGLSGPLWMLIGFELAYIVRKKRSSNFFCLTFDQGHRTKEGACTSAVRYSIWLLSFMLVFVSAIGNSAMILNPSAFAYRASMRFSSKALDISRLSQGFGLTEFVDVVPEGLAMLFSIQMGISLWRYGTAQSMDVSATALNRWAWVTISTVGQLLAWFLQPTDWVAPYAYNSCIIVVVYSFLMVESLIHVNIRELERLQQSIQKDNEEVKQDVHKNLPPRFRNVSPSGDASLPAAERVAQLRAVKSMSSVKSQPRTPSSSFAVSFPRGAAVTSADSKVARGVLPAIESQDSEGAELADVTEMDFDDDLSFRRPLPRGPPPAPSALGSSSLRPPKVVRTGSHPTLAPASSLHSEQ